MGYVSQGLTVYAVDQGQRTKQAETAANQYPRSRDPSASH